MNIRTAKHHLGVAVKNLILNRLMTVASILTVASCVFIVSVFYLLVTNVNYMFNRLQDQIVIVAFVDDAVTWEDLPGLLQRINAIPNVRVAELVDADDDIDFLHTLFPDGVPLSLLEDTPFRRAFSVDIVDIRLHSEVAAALWDMSPDIANVRNDQEIVDATLSIIRVVQTVSLFIILILAVISFVIIINTIRITVSSRRTEINIMKYVGATHWFIRWPFIIEGVIIGLLGALIPVVICVMGYNSAVGALTSIQMLDFAYFLSADSVLVYVVPLALGLGAFIGFIGAVISIRQYLKV